MNGGGYRQSTIRHPKSCNCFHNPNFEALLVYSLDLCDIFSDQEKNWGSVKISY